MAVKKKASKKVEAKPKAVVAPVIKEEPKKVAEEIKRPPINPDIPAIAPKTSDPRILKAMEKGKIKESDFISTYVFTDKVVFDMKDRRRIVVSI
jgi:hypothetical protein